ncbi:MAG: hypothetical protein ACI9OF_000455, partial [Saprospiraceae bacterium]
ADILVLDARWLAITRTIDHYLIVTVCEKL